MCALKTGLERGASLASWGSWWTGDVLNGWWAEPVEIGIYIESSPDWRGARGGWRGAHIESEGKMKSRYRMIAGPNGEDANVGRIKETMVRGQR